MKKLILILFVLISMEAFSQISVKEGSFKHIPEGVILNKNEYTDINNHPMALIKISTENINEYERGRLRFAGNMATEVIKEYDTGKVLVYLTAKNATFLKIAHPDYGECKYQLENLCDYCVYEMVVRYDGNPNNENTLIIKTDQVDANIYIDNEYIDKQYGHKRLMVGSTHTWKIECDSFRTESGEITITNDENVIDIKMLSVFVDITVKTDYKSYIFIDGVQKAKGSWTGKLMEGTYVFESRKENHRTIQKTVVVAAGNNQTIILDSPESINGSLDVSSIPTGADIYIDEKKYGKTPNFINEIIIGNHKLKIEKQGYATITKDITIKEGKILTIDDKLQIRKEQNSYYGLYKGNKKAPRYNVSGLKINWALYDVPNGSYIKPFKDGVVCFALRDDKNNSYGCIDRSGKIIIKPIYTSHFEFKDGIAVVEKNGKKGIIDKKGKQLLPLGDYKFIYEITECSNHGLYIVVNTDEKRGLFYNNELFIPCEYDALWSFNYPIIELKDSSQNKVLYLNIENGEYYDFVYEVGDNVWAKKNNEYYCFEKGTGRVLSNELYKQNSLGYSFFYDEQSKKYGIVDSENKIIKEPSYFSLSEQFPVFWYKDRAIVISSDTSYMFLSESGDVLIKTEKGESLFWTKEYWTEEEEYIKTAKGKYGVDRKEGLYTIDGEQVFPTEYESIVHIYKDYFNIKKCDGEEYLHNIKTNKIYNAKVWYVSLTEDLMLEMSDGDNDFYLNLETDSVTSNYRITHPFSEGLAVVEDENYKKYIIDKNGNVILQENNRLSIYGDEFSEGVIWVYDVYNKVDGFIYNPLLKK